MGPAASVPFAPAIQAGSSAWVEVDLGALRANLRQLRGLARPAGILAVVKSEAYGHGMLPVARALVEEGVWGLAVAQASEGVRLREAGLSPPVLVAGPVIPAEMGEAIRAGLTLAVFDLELARELARQARALDREVSIHVKVDTGLGRLSTPVDRALDFVLEVSRLPGLRLEGLYSHFADAEGLDQAYTLSQFRRFQEFSARLAEAGVVPRLRHLAGSAAAMLLPETRLDLVRPGIALYGLWPARETRLLMASSHGDLLHRVNAPFLAIPEERRGGGQGGDLLEGFLSPALSFKTVVVQVKEVSEGDSVGYGCTFRATRPTRIAVLPLGYADGCGRGLGNRAEVLIRGRRARVVGRVCMNLMMIDVTDVAGARPGDEVVLIGRQGGEAVTAEEWASWLDTIHYEVVTRIPAHVPRVYLGEERSPGGGARPV